VDVYLTDREAEVMDVLWKAGPSLVAEVRAQLPEEFAYTTVLTVLRTLEAKGYADHSTEGRGHRYFAKVEQNVARRSALQHLTQELPGAVVGGIGEEFRGWALFDDDAVVHEDDAIGDVLGKAHLVRHHQHRPPFQGQRPHHVKHFANQLWIEGRCRLIEQEKLRLHGQRPSDGDTLLLPAGEPLWILVGFVRQSNFLQ